MKDIFGESFCISGRVLAAFEIFQSMNSGIIWMNWKREALTPTSYDTKETIREISIGNWREKN